MVFLYALPIAISACLGKTLLALGFMFVTSRGVGTGDAGVDSGVDVGVDPLANFLGKFGQN